MRAPGRLDLVRSVVPRVFSAAAVTRRAADIMHRRRRSEVCPVARGLHDRSFNDDRCRRRMGRCRANVDTEAELRRRGEGAGGGAEQSARYEDC